MTPRWRPFASVRSRILGWSVLLLTAALAASTAAMHVFLVRQLDGRVNAELAHEIAEFRALEAQLGGAADGGGDGAASAPANSVTTLLRTRASGHQHRGAVMTGAEAPPCGPSGGHSDRATSRRAIRPAASEAAHSAPAIVAATVIGVLPGSRSRLEPAAGGWDERERLMRQLSSAAGISAGNQKIPG